MKRPVSIVHSTATSQVRIKYLVSDGYRDGEIRCVKMLGFILTRFDVL